MMFLQNFFFLVFLSTMMIPLGSAVPLAQPALGTLAVFSFLQTDNQSLWRLLVTNGKGNRSGVTLALAGTQVPGSARENRSQ